MRKASFLVSARSAVLYLPVVPNVAIAPHRPSPRPRAHVSVGGHLLQHSTTPTSGCAALSAEHDHGDASVVQAPPIGVEDDGVIPTHGQIPNDQQHLKGQHPERPYQQRLHAPSSPLPRTPGE